MNLRIPHYGPKRLWFDKDYDIWPLVWLGGDEWCNRTLVIRLPIWAMIINLGIPMRTSICDECAELRWGR